MNPVEECPSTPQSPDFDYHRKVELATLDRVDNTLEGLQGFTRGDCRVKEIRKLIAERITELSPARSGSEQKPNYSPDSGESPALNIDRQKTQ